MPEVIRAIIRTTRLLPEQIGTFANDLVQTRLSFRQHAMRISEWGQLASAADVHLGIKTLEFIVRDQLRVARRLQRLVFERVVLCGGADSNRKRVQNLGTLLFNVDQALRHEPLLVVAAAYLDRQPPTVRRAASRPPRSGRRAGNSGRMA